MPIVGTYRAEALPYYGCLIVADPALSGTEEADLARCLTDAEATIIGGSRWRVAVKAAQDTLPIAVTLDLEDTELDPDWERCRELTVEFPTGHLQVENISAGPIPLSPGDLEQLPLPGGPGLYRIMAWHRGRDRAAAAVQALWDADEPDESTHAGLEEYLLQIRCTRPTRQSRTVPH